MFEGDNIPGNITTREITMENCGWILIGILIFLVILISIFFLAEWYKSSKKINHLKNIIENDFNDEEKKILLKYQNLKNRDKDLVNKLLEELSDDTKHHKE